MAADVPWRLGPDSEKYNAGRYGQPAPEHELAEVTVKGDDDPLLGRTEGKHLFVWCARTDEVNRYDIISVRLQTADGLQRNILVSEETGPTQGRA